MGKETEIITIPKGIHAAEHEGTLDPVYLAFSRLRNPELQSFENLLRNGDFEIGDPPVEWVDNAAAGATFARSAVQVRIGAYSYLLVRAAVSPECYQRILDGVRYRNRVLTFSCWVWCATAGIARIRLNDGVAASALSQWHTGSSTWELLTATIVVDPASTFIDAFIYMAINPGTAYFDGAICVEGSLCPAFSPKPAELVVEETQVYAAAAPVAWTDLDLSAFIGENPAIVMLKITETGDAGTVRMAVRTNGDTDMFYNPACLSVAQGLCGQNSQFHCVLLVATDPVGIIEWYADFARTVTVDIIGYVKC